MSQLSVILVVTIFVAVAFAAPPASVKDELEQQHPAPLTEIEGSALNPSLYQQGNQDTLETAEHRHYGYGHHRGGYGGYGGYGGGYGGGYRGGYGGYRGGYGGGYGGYRGGYGGGYGGYGGYGYYG